MEVVKLQKRKEFNVKKKDFHKGQTVWIYLVGNAARGTKTLEERIQEWEKKKQNLQKDTKLTRVCQ